MTSTHATPRKRHFGGDMSGEPVVGGCGCGGDEADPDSFEAFGTTVTGGGSYEKGAASFGRVYSVIGAIIGIIIAIIMIFAGVSKLRDPHTSTATATVTSVTSCHTSAQNGATSYDCIVDATYPIGGVKYAVKGLEVTRSAPVQKGSTFTIHYDPSTPSDAVYELSPRGLGWGLIGFGILIGGITTGIAVAAHKSTGFAAGYGTVEGVSMIARAF